MKSAVLFLSLRCFLPNVICSSRISFSLIYCYWWLAVLCQPVPVAGMKRRELAFALLVIGDRVALRHCTRKKASVLRNMSSERRKMYREYLACLELGTEPWSPMHLIQPPSYWLVQRLAWHSGLLIFHLLCVCILAAAFWNSAGEFLNLGVQINGMKVSETSGF